MPGPGTPESTAQTPDAALRGLARRLALARLALAWEAAWRAAWPLALLAGLFFVVALVFVVVGFFAVAAAVVHIRVAVDGDVAGGE